MGDLRYGKWAHKQTGLGGRAADNDAREDEGEQNESENESEDESERQRERGADGQEGELPQGGDWREGDSLGEAKGEEAADVWREGSHLQQGRGSSMAADAARTAVWHSRQQEAQKLLLSLPQPLPLHLHAWQVAFPRLTAASDSRSAVRHAQPPASSAGAERGAWQDSGRPGRGNHGASVDGQHRASCTSTSGPARGATGNYSSNDRGRVRVAAPLPSHFRLTCSLLGWQPPEEEAGELR